MAAAIEKRFPAVEVELVEGGRGDFIVTVDGNRIWDKRRMDDAFPENQAILDMLAGIGA